MTEVNIFKDHERFEQRGNPGVEVDWHWWESIGRATYVADDGSFTYVKADGSNSLNNVPGAYDLIPMLPPPVMVPWNCPEDVPDPCWVRVKAGGHLIGAFNGLSTKTIDNWPIFGQEEIPWENLQVFHEWHTNRKAKDGWQVCGKLKDAQK